MCSEARAAAVGAQAKDGAPSPCAPLFNGSAIGTVTGWRDASTAKSGLYWDVRQQGYGCRTVTDEATGEQRYHLVLPKGVGAPLGHVEPAAVRIAANTSPKRRSSSGISVCAHFLN